ncbi:MAG: DUF115 domain-containing protein [Spirochaetaceae bacterium]|jgi:hypothetical protein|nr:DUF115 domain-containing protein [Spirochaetaceae bacterium]
MTERLASTGSGFPTVYAGERAIHSRYDPPGEAEKYSNSLTFREGIRFFILMEPGLGYGISPLKKKFPGAKIIVLHLSDFFSREAPPGVPEADAVWTPGGGVSLQKFLEGEVPDTDAAFIGIVEWRPSLYAYGEIYRRVLSDTADFIKRIDANRRTLRGFGRRWFRNALRNILIVKKTLTLSPGSVPFVITGAGPSLEEAIPLIRERKKGLFVLAVSSSVPALLAGRITPDLIMSADGGGWALFHLYETVRGGRSPALAIHLTAALPSQYAGTPILVISDGTLWQRIILRRASVPFIVLPQRGTVTASALDLAFLLTAGRVLIAGADLAHRDIRTHARPYSFDRLQHEGATRFFPAYSRAYTRAKAITASGSHNIYAAWFRRQMAEYPKRLFSLGGNNPVFDVPGNFEDGDPGGPYPAETVGTPPPGGSGEGILETLMEALEAPQSSGILQGELGPLLFPDKTPSPGELKEMVFRTGKTYFGGRHG